MCAVCYIQAKLRIYICTIIIIIIFKGEKYIYEFSPHSWTIEEEKEVEKRMKSNI